MGTKNGDCGCGPEGSPKPDRLGANQPSRARPQSRFQPSQERIRNLPRDGSEVGLMRRSLSEIGRSVESGLGRMTFPFANGLVNLPSNKVQMPLAEQPTLRPSQGTGQAWNAIFAESTRLERLSQSLTSDRRDANSLTVGPQPRILERSDLHTNGPAGFGPQLLTPGYQKPQDLKELLENPEAWPRGESCGWEQAFKMGIDILRSVEYLRKEIEYTNVDDLIPKLEAFQKSINDLASSDAGKTIAKELRDDVLRDLSGGKQPFTEPINVKGVLKDILANNGFIDPTVPPCDGMCDDGTYCFLDIRMTWHTLASIELTGNSSSDVQYSTINGRNIATVIIYYEFKIHADVHFIASCECGLI
jgi:hypothetical protein